MTNPSKTYGTSASRMLEILRLAKGTSQDNSAYPMWCEVFGITVNDSDPLISTSRSTDQADLMQLSADIKEQSAAHTKARNVDLYMRNYSAVDVCLQRFPYAVQNTVRQQIDAVDRRQWRCRSASSSAGLTPTN